MKTTILFLAIIAVIFSVHATAQDINEIFNNNVTLATQLSSQTRAIDALMSSYGNTQTKIYSYSGSFEEAVRNMKAPINADVSTVTNQLLSSNFSMFFLMTENLNPKPMNDEWYKKAKEKVNELADKTGQSLTITITSGKMQTLEKPSLGEKIEMRIITLSNPYVDMDNLKVIEGTWVTEVLASTTVTQEMLTSETTDLENEWDEEELDMDVNIPQGAQFVKFDEVSDTELLQGDVNYIVEMSDDKAIEFFKGEKKRYVNSFEQYELDSQNGSMMTTFYLLKHKGELKSGDDVVSLTIQPAPKSILSDVLG